jgi:hypothetical protein
MNDLLRPRIWSSFLASSGVGPCDVPLRYASDQSRGTAGRLPGGTPIFAVSLQQFMKYSGSPNKRRLGSLRKIPNAGYGLRTFVTAVFF